MTALTRMGKRARSPAMSAAELAESPEPSETGRLSRSARKTAMALTLLSLASCVGASSASSIGGSCVASSPAFVCHSNSQRSSGFDACNADAIRPCQRTARTTRTAQFAASSDENDSQEFNVFLSNFFSKNGPSQTTPQKTLATLLTTLTISLSFLANPLTPHLPLSTHFSASAEDELYAKYGSRPLDTSLVDQSCLVNHCSLQAKACLQDDPDCRKGLTCTAKCMGDNACITGCFARYGDGNLDELLKCTIEDHECIKVAILEGGGDEFGSEPRGPAMTYVAGRSSGTSGKDWGFDVSSMEGTWYKVVGYNPNYDCYDCQRNTFSSPEGGWLENMQRNVNLPSGGILGALGNVGNIGSVGADRLQVDVEFSMPRLLPDGSPLPPSGTRESFDSGLQSVGYNAYSTHETMIFDNINDGRFDGLANVANLADGLELLLGKDGDERLYSRTAHSEGEMFGLKFWENWYVIGQNDPGQPEFKFIYYNGKTRQNTYDGAFVYSRTRTLPPASMEKVYQIAKGAGMNPDQFCKIHNGCFDGERESGASGASGMINEPKIPMIKEREGLGSPSNPFRGIIASTKISQFLGVESVAAESVIPTTISKEFLQGSPSAPSAPSSSAKGLSKRPWWKEVGDYLEDPRRHFQYMDSLREDMDWPDYIKNRSY